MSSKEVFALRKSGSINEAYAMALGLMKQNPRDEWNIKAFAWCAFDLAKNAINEQNFTLAQQYVRQLERLNIDKSDDILYKAVEKIKAQSDPNKKIIFGAKQLSFEGKDEEAFPIFITAIKKFPADSDLIKSFGWTLSKLLKKAIDSNDKAKCKELLIEYKAIEKRISDEKLARSLVFLQQLADDERQVIREAKEKSKQGLHQEALQLFRQAVQKFPDDSELHEQFAWELQKEGKILFEKESVNVAGVRRLLAEYIKLKNNKPSRLHSQFLRFADKIIDSPEFNLIAFLRLWDLKNLTEEDFEPFVKEDKNYPSLAEKVIQHASKMIAEKKSREDVDYILPFLDLSISKFPDNIWLTYNKAKLLHLVERNQDAINFLVPVVKEKISEYWSWALLGDLLINTDAEKAFSCFCKALLCKTEEKYLSNIRISLSEILIQKNLLKEAKHEINLAIKSKIDQEVKIPEKLKQLQSSDWYITTTESESNISFYNQHKQISEEIIFDYLPWLDACIGEVFTTPEKPDKPRRKLFIKGTNGIFEVVVSDKKFNASKRFRIGDSAKIKGEYDKEKVFQIYLLDKRPNHERWDIFNWEQGNIINCLKERDNVVAWKVAVNIDKKIIEGAIDVTAIPKNLALNEGSPINIKFFKKEVQKQSASFYTSKEIKLQLLSIYARPNGKNWDVFPNSIGVIDHINFEKGIAHFIINKQIDGIIRINSTNEAIQVGKYVSVKLRKVNKDKEFYYTTLDFHLTTETPIEKLLKSFQGSVKFSGTAGFVEDVYIESSLLLRHNIEENNQLKGVAILNFNKKKGSWGWKAIEIMNLNPNN